MTTRLGRYPHLLKTSPLDVALVILIVVGSIALAWPERSRADQARPESNTALIYQDGNLLYQIDLRQQRTVTLPRGGVTVRVRDGKVSVIEADCPKHVCIHTGAINRPGQIIACVPNKVLIEIKSTKPAFLDAVAN